MDPSAAAREAGLDPEALADPEARIDGARADELWRVLYRRTGDPLLALRAAERPPQGAYRVVDFVGAYSPTLGEGLRRVAEYFPLIDPRGELKVHQTATEWVLDFGAAGGAPLPPPAQQYTLASLVVRSRVSTGCDWTPERVELTFSASPAEAKVHREVFRGPVHFDRPHCRLVLSGETARTPVPRAQPELLAVLDDHARRLLAETRAEADEPIAGLERTILSQLTQGGAALEATAKALAITPRTLQRRLEGQGTSFGAVVDEVRYAVARAQLMKREVAIAEIAFLLGYADQAAFTRAFKRWSGTTPAAWRGRGALDATKKGVR